MNDIFRTVNELLNSRDCVMSGNAVQSDGALYGDSVENLHALHMMEPSLLELMSACERAGMGELQCFREVAALLGFDS
jgi:hypothetical protein